MNNVNSISQMNSVVCEHSSLMGHEAKKGPMMGGGENGPDGNIKAALTLVYMRASLTLQFFNTLQVTARSTHYCHPTTVAQRHPDLVLPRVFAQTRSSLITQMVTPNV